MMEWLAVFIRRNRKWIIIGVIALVIGIGIGWRLAGSLRGGLIGGLAVGGAALGFTKYQEQRRREAERLAEERRNIEEVAGETDRMIEQYQRKRGEVQ